MYVMFVPMEFPRIFEPRTKSNVYILVMATVVLLGVAGILTHEWWEDEASVWLSVVGSHSILELFHNLGFNGHPRFYYIIVYGVQSLFGHPLALSFLNLFFSLLAIAFFMCAAPFSRLQKVFFAFGFFPLYQYGIIVRGYSLFVCVFFAYCYFKTQRPNALLIRYLLLAVLAQIHLIAATVAVLLFIEEYLEDHRSYWGSFFVIGSLLLVAWQLKPSGVNHSGLLLPENPWMAFRSFANGFMPNFGIFRLAPLRTGFQITVGTFLWIASWIVAWRHRQIVRYYLPLTFSLFIISAVIYTGERWHHGFYFIYFVTAIWLSTQTVFNDVFSRRFVTGLFALHAALGIYAIALDIMTPYSNGPQVAKFIQQNQLEGLPIVGIEAFPEDHGTTGYKFVAPAIFPVILHLPQSSIYDPNTGNELHFWSHYDDKMYFPPHQDLNSINKDLERIDAALAGAFLVVVVQNKKIHNLIMPNSLQRLATFPMTYDFGEHMALYTHP